LKSALKSPNPKSHSQKKLGWNEDQDLAVVSSLKKIDLKEEEKAFKFSGDLKSDKSSPSLENFGKEPEENSKTEFFSPKDCVIERTRIGKNWLVKKTRDDYLKFLLNGFHIVGLKDQLKNVSVLLVVFY